MALQPNGQAPYTTAAAITTVLDAWRERGFGTPVTTDVLIRAGVPETLGRRTLASMTALELVDSGGNPTDQFQDFRQTRGDEEYRARLQEWLRGVYADVLQYADPSADSYERVTEAFRGYQPDGQRRAMAGLLLGLWRYAGLPVAASATSDSAVPRVRAHRRSAGTPRKPKGERVALRGHSAGVGGASGTLGATVGDLPPGLIGLLHQIPSGGRSWTSDRRDGFLQAFRAVLDFSVPVDDNPGVEAGHEDEGLP